MSDTTYFRGLSRSQYEAFRRALEPGAKLRRGMVQALLNVGVLDEDGAYWDVPDSIRFQHAVWRSAHFYPDGKRISHLKKSYDSNHCRN